MKQCPICGNVLEYHEDYDEWWCEMCAEFFEVEELF